MHEGKRRTHAVPIELPDGVPHWTDSKLIESVQRGRRDADVVHGDMSRITEVGLYGLTQYLPGIVALDLTRCAITDSGLNVIGQRCTMLRRLILNGCTGTMENGFATITKRCRQIRHLELNNCPGLTTVALGTIGRLRNLEYLSLNDSGTVDDIAMGQIIRSCPVRVVSIQNCPLVTDLTVRMLAISNVASSTIRYLSVGNSDISDEGIVNVALTCHELRHLDFTNCYDVSDVAMNEIAYGLPLLRSLFIQGCSRITDASLVPFANRLRGLKALRAGNCEGLTDYAVMALAENCPNLRYLDVQGCMQVTDFSMRDLLRRCTRLEELLVCGCRNVTDQTMLYACDLPLKHLGVLDIRLCSHISKPAERALARAHPHLTICRIA